MRALLGVVATTFGHGLVRFAVVGLANPFLLQCWVSQRLRPVNLKIGNSFLLTVRSDFHVQLTSFCRYAKLPQTKVELPCRDDNDSPGGLLALRVTLLIEVQHQRGSSPRHLVLEFWTVCLLLLLLLLVCSIFSLKSSCFGLVFRIVSTAA